MKGKRFFHTLALIAIGNASKRADYLRKHKVFKEIGEHCIFMPRIVPLYPNLIKIGNNVDISSGVILAVHSNVHGVLNNLSKTKPDDEKSSFNEVIGCIEIGDNVFVGVNAIITGNVKIGSNVIISAGSLIENDIPDNSVVRGVPAKRMCTVDQLYDIMKAKSSYPDELAPEMGTFVGKELEDWLWKEFHEVRQR